jgi:Tol biopolymer transport system component
MTDKRSGKEAFTFTDRVTGRTVRQLTNSDRRSVHGYYDLPPWNRQTGQIAFSSMTAPGATEGDVYMMDRDGDHITYLAHSEAMSPNDGARVQWSADGSRVYFADREGDQRLIAWVDVRTGEKNTYPGDLRMMSPTDNVGVYHTQCGDYPDHEVLARREDHGVFVQNLDDGTSVRIVSVADCWRTHPRRDEIADWHLYVKHTKWSPDGKRLMFVFTNEIRYASKYAELPRVKDIYVVNADGTGLKRVGEFGNHPLWHPNGREILSNSRYEDSDWNCLVLTNVETGVQRLAASSISGSGHPSFSPDGRWVVVDHVLSGQGYGSLNLVDVEADTVQHLAQFRVTNHTHTGTHLHPAWSHDSQQVLYASDASGVAQLCVIDI